MARARFSWILAGLLSVLPAAAQDSPEILGDEYESGDFGRVRYSEGGVELVRAPAPGVAPHRDDGTLNAPIFPGDAALTGRGQRVEIELAGGTLVRLDADSELVFQALPDPYAEQPDSPLLKLARGSVQLNAELRETEEFRIDTPHASIYLLGAGDFRIDVEDRTTRVLSRSGVLEVVGDGGSVLVRGGMQTHVASGALPADPEVYNSFRTDTFDRWVEQRVDNERFRDRYATRQEYEPYDELPGEVRPYYRELSRYGRWIHVDPYGAVWYPYGTSAGWRPYYDGYWEYGPGGYFWVSYEPWGWAPYHYGRWSWVAGFGWCWIPGRVFGGAWVSWSWGSLHVGWAPLGFYNRPAYVHGYHYGYYDPGAWCFVSYTHITYRRYHHHYVSYEVVRPTLTHTAVVTRAPRVPPAELAADPGLGERVARRTRDNPGNRLPRIDGTARSPRVAFNEGEERIVRRGRAQARTRPVLRNDESPVRARPAARPARVTGATPSSPRVRTGTAAPRRETGTTPRLQRTPARTGAADRSAGAGRTAVRPRPTEPGGGDRAADRSRRGSTGRVPAATSGSGGATDRQVRELYRRSAEPRRTRPSERPVAPAPRATSRPASRPAPPRATSRPASRPTPSRATSRPASRPTPSRATSKPSSRPSPSKASGASKPSKPKSSSGGSSSSSGGRGKGSRGKSSGG